MFLSPDGTEPTWGGVDDARYHINRLGDRTSNNNNNDNLAIDCNHHNNYNNTPRSIY